MFFNIYYNQSKNKKKNICYDDYLDSNSKSLSDVYDIYDVNNNNKGIINQSNSIQQHQYPKHDNTFIINRKDKVEKNETTSYMSYRPDRIGPLHRKYLHSDTWACDNCTISGDWWFMEKHPCKKKS